LAVAIFDFGFYPPSLFPDARGEGADRRR